MGTLTLKPSLSPNTNPTMCRWRFVGIWSETQRLQLLSEVLDWLQMTAKRATGLDGRCADGRRRNQIE